MTYLIKINRLCRIFLAMPFAFLAILFASLVCVARFAYLGSAVTAAWIGGLADDEDGGGE